MKSIATNEFESECIPSACLVGMLRKIAEKPLVEISEAKEGRGMRLFGKTLLIIGALYFAIHLIVFWVKP